MTLQNVISLLNEASIEQKPVKLSDEEEQPIAKKKKFKKKAPKKPTGKPDGKPQFASKKHQIEFNSLFREELARQLEMLDEGFTFGRKNVPFTRTSDLLRAIKSARESGKGFKVEKTDAKDDQGFKITHMVKVGGKTFYITDSVYTLKVKPLVA